MIRFDNWTIQADGDILARQFDNLTRTLAVSGDLPSGWDWAMLVQVGAAMDIIPLTAAEGALSAVLTAQQLSISGYYNMQLRGTQGERVRHTNTVNVYIPASLSGDEQWPTVPSEFTDLERRVTEKVKQAEGYSSHPPVIGENGNWWEWDGASYVDTDRPSRGEQGPQGTPGELTVRQGNTLYANALKGTASGAMVRMDDVSVLEHGVKVKVSGVDDPTAVTVTAAGKNIANMQAWSAAVTYLEPRLTNMYGTTIDTTLPQNSITVTQSKWDKPNTVNSFYNGYIEVALKHHLIVGQTYTISFDIEVLDNPLSASYLYLLPNDTRASQSTVEQEPYVVGGKYRIRADVVYTLSTSHPEQRGITIRNCGMSFILSNFMITPKSDDIQYEPFHGEEYTLTEDGTCEVVSIAPTMTLMTDTAGATIECEYNRDINKAFEQLTQAIISMGGNI